MGVEALVLLADEGKAELTVFDETCGVPPQIGFKIYVDASRARFIIGSLLLFFAG